MKPLLTLLALLTLGLCAARADVAAELTALKEDFPAYPVAREGFRFNTSDPIVKDCREKYAKAIAAISPATIEQSVTYLRKQLAEDMARYEAAMKTLKKDGTPYQNHRANAYWLKAKVAPFLGKIEALAKS